MYALLHTTQNALFMQNYTSFVNFEKNIVYFFSRKSAKLITTSIYAKRHFTGFQHFSCHIFL